MKALLLSKETVKVKISISSKVLKEILKKKSDVGYTFPRPGPGGNFGELVCTVSDVTEITLLKKFDPDTQWQGTWIYIYNDTQSRLKMHEFRCLYALYIGRLLEF